MFTFKILRKENTGLLFVRIFRNRVKAEFNLSISVGAKEFEDAMALVSTSSRNRLASYIRTISSQLNLLAVEYAQIPAILDMPASRLRDKLRAEILHVDEPQEDDNSLFMPFYSSYLASKLNEGYLASCTYTFNKIKEYCPDSDKLSFEDISIKWLNGFDLWLAKSGLSQNTRAIHLKNIRTVINRAIDEELTQNYPFRRIKIKQEETRKRSLPVEEIRRLFTCEVEPYQEVYRDMFRLMFMLRGINAVDLFNLKEITPEGRVEYRRAKTHRLYSIKVEPEAMEIIEKYRGQKNLLMLADRWKSHKDFNKWMNDALKKIGEMKRVGRGGKKEITAFWPDISSYWARHSWATIAYNDLDISKNVISQGLGHNYGLAMTEIYLDKDRKKVDAANRRIIDWVLYGKL